MSQYLQWAWKLATLSLCHTLLIYYHPFLPHLDCAHPQRLFWPWQHHEQNTTGYPTNTSEEHMPYPTWQLQWQQHERDAAEQNATGHPANTSVEHTLHPTWQL
jgi:hypothetical protein